MAFNKAPSNWLANWSENGTDITVPIATFPEMTADEADGATGDIRKVLFAFCEKIYKEWAARPAADQPTQMVISKSASTNATTGVITNVYTLRFVNEISAQDVSAEPS